jgi:hypothetical protein
VPISKIQTDILRLIASHRDRDAPRYSSDIDVFHDREERVARAAEQDSALLQEHGYLLQWIRREPNIYAVLAQRANETTKLEWVVDSDFRFFPAMRDETFTPEGIINEIRRVARYTEADFRRLDSDPPLDPAATMTRLREVLSEAEAFVTRMPTDKVGLLFLQGSQVVQPDPGRLEDYQTHAGQRRGQWPSNSEITAAMFELYTAS